MTVPNSAPLLGTATVTAAPGVSTTAGTVLATGLESFSSVVLYATIVGSAGGTTDVYAQSRHGNSAWVDLVHFPQVAGGGATVNYRVPLSRAGTVAAPVVVGTAAVPALGANAVVPGDFGDAIRLVAVTGAGAAGLTTSSCAVYAAANPISA